MDRKAFAACAGLISVSAVVLGVAWSRAHRVGASVSPADRTPATFAKSAAEQCTWKPLANQFALPAPGATVRIRTTKLPPVAAAPPISEPAQPVEALATEVQRQVVAMSTSVPAQPVRVEAATPDEISAAAPDVAAQPRVAEQVAIAGAEDERPLQLPWARANNHSPEMIAVLTRADQRVRHGFQLAQRGALYSARAEFVGALQLIAQANDAQQGTQMYGKGLEAGLLALREAGAFMRQLAGGAAPDVRHTIASHKTAILKDEDVSQISATTAAQRYFTYAQEQLAAAAATEMPGSMALFGLGKVSLASQVGRPMPPLERTANAMAYYQAALMVDGRNFLAANELAVLEVGNGNLQRARDLLIHSVTQASQSATWHNLSVVHTMLGETELADQARAQAATAPKSPHAGPTPAVQWLDPAAFARTSSATDGLIPPAAGAAPAPPAAVPTPAAAPAATSKGGRLSGLLPWTTRR